MVKFNLCMRIESPRTAESGGWLHPVELNQPLRELPPIRRKRSDEELDRQWGVIASRASKDCDLSPLAKELGVAESALRLLGVGYTVLGGTSCWTFPERNETGLCVGINRRLVNPRGDKNKLCAKGSKRGLYYADTWINQDGPVVLVEGGSDAAAGLTMGIRVIGRPSNTGGLGMLAAMLSKIIKPVIILAENDKKPDGLWPGRDGAVKTAKYLAERTKRRVLIRQTPEGHKDLRTYLNAIDANLCDLVARRAAVEKITSC
jgi:hypothetical protein